MPLIQSLIVRPNSLLETTVALRPHNKIQGQIKGSISFDSDIIRAPEYQIDRISCASDALTSENPLPDIQRIMIFLSRGKTTVYPLGDEILTVQELKHTIDTLKQSIYRGLENQYEAIWRTLIADTALFVAARPTFDSISTRSWIRCVSVIKACDKTEIDALSLSRLCQDPETQQLWHSIQAQDAGPYYLNW